MPSSPEQDGKIESVHECDPKKRGKKNGDVNGKLKIQSKYIIQHTLPKTNMEA